MWEIIGWIAWVFTVYLALSFAYGCRKWARQGYSFQWATAVQTFFWWVITIVFLLAPLNKLHILWLLPVLYFAAQYIALVDVPILRKPVLLLTELFMELVLVGTKNPSQTAASFWLRSMQGMEPEHFEEFNKIVTDFFIPDNINPAKFRANTRLLFDRGVSLISGEEEKDDPTPSVRKYHSFFERPMGIPIWFIAAYPDVTSWTDDESKKEGSILLDILGNIPEEELHDNDRHIKPQYLRQLIDAYRKETAKDFECAIR